MARNIERDVAACRRKTHAYKTERIAANAALLLRLSAGPSLGHYRCYICGKWHLGHSENRR